MLNILPWLHYGQIYRVNYIKKDNNCTIYSTNLSPKCEHYFKSNQKKNVIYHIFINNMNNERIFDLYYILYGNH